MSAQTMLAIAIVLGLLLAACGQAAAPAAPTQAPAAAAAKPDAAKVEYPTMSFKAGSPFAQDHIMGIALDRFAKNMSEMSGGKITVEVFHAGSLVTGKNELDVLSKGVVDFSSISSPYHAGSLPYFDEVTLLPFIYNYKTLAAVFQKAKPQFEQELAKYQIRLLAHWPEIIGFFLPKPIDPKKPDFSGLKMRSAGGTMTYMIRHFGASTVDMPSPEVPVALRTGVVQGLGTSLFSWDTLGIMDDAPYAYYTGESLFFFFFAMHTERYPKLPPAVQQLVDKAALATEQWVYENVQRLEADIVKKAKAKPKVQAHELSADEVQIWRQKMQPVYDDFAKRHGDKAAQFLKLAGEARAAAPK